MSPLAALLLAVLTPCARAGVLSFDAGPKDGAVYSADGYHLARLENDGREDRWLVDGRVRARGRSGTLPGGGVLSADGSKLLSLVTVADENGKPAAGAACDSCSLVVDDAGRAFQDVLLVSVSDDAQMHSFYLDGRELRKGGRPPRVGLLAGGAHFVYPMLTPRGVGVGFDGRDLEYGLPLPLPSAPVEFDGPNEYHYWTLEGEGLRIVCGTLDGSDPKASRCAERARRVFTPVE